MKPLRWVGSSKQDLLAFPAEVMRGIGYAMHFAQMGDKHPSAKPLKGFGSAGVLEVVEDFARDTYRVVYTVRLRHGVYVLHAFQKKAKHGVATPAREIEMVRNRLRRAMEMDEEGR